MVRPASPGRRYRYTVHRPGKHLPGSRQGRLIFLVRHQEGHPVKRGPFTTTLKKTGETVGHHQLHYGGGARAIAICEDKDTPGGLEITSHDIHHRTDRSGGLPIFEHGDPGHETYGSIREAVDGAVKHATLFRPVTAASREALRQKLREIAGEEWGEE